MKPPPFEYLRAGTLAEAVSALATDAGATVLAGGQSLVPLMAMRRVRPTLLVDLAGIGLDDVVVADGGVQVGAMVTQRRIELDPQLGAAVPLLAVAAGHVGYPSTRTRGTIGGSLAHADPSAELAAVGVALGATVIAEGPGGRREIACGDLAAGPFATTLERAEVITAVVLRTAGPRHGAAWCEWSPRAHDFAAASAGVAVELDGTGTCTALWAVAGCVGGGPLALSDVLSAVVAGAAAGPAVLRAAAAAVERAAASAGPDRAPLTGLLAARALHRAFERARHPVGASA